VHFTSLANHIERLEAKLGRIGFAIALAIVLMIIAAIYVRPAIRTVAMGNSYAALSSDPLGHDNNPVGYRILTPLISYLMGLRGQFIIITNLFFATVLLVLSYCYYRSLEFEPFDAILGTSILTFSLVTMTTIYYGGYCDSLTYIIVFLMYWCRTRPLVVSFLLLLGLLNRESIIMLMPWYLYIALLESGNKKKTLVLYGVGIAAVLSVYWGYREWVSSLKEVYFDMDYYFDPLKTDLLKYFKKSFGYQALGLFTVFKAFWFLVLVTVFYWWKTRQWHQLISIAILVGVTWLQMLIAWDSSRMMTLCFPIMIISVTYLKQTNCLDFRSWAWYLVVSNFFVPQLYTSGNIIEKMHSTIAKLAAMILLKDVNW